MRLLADECLDARLVEGLRRAGHDVLAIRDQWRGAGDRAVLDRARNEPRTLITEDKGFGDLVVKRGLSVPGLILVRYSQRDIRAVLERLVAVVAHHGVRLRDLFVVVTPLRTRVRRLGPPRDGRGRAAN
jgi:predicted nuclease of predicted toxin-antitoxin system